MPIDNKVIRVALYGCLGIHICAGVCAIVLAALQFSCKNKEICVSKFMYLQHTAWTPTHT
jgi:hypothetical protein